MWVILEISRILFTLIFLINKFQMNFVIYQFFNALTFWFLASIIALKINPYDK
jgi:hypothetical protein